MCCAVEYRFLRFLPKYFPVNHYCSSNYYLNSIQGDSDSGLTADSSVSAFVLVRILFHFFPVSTVTFEAFHRIRWPKMDSTKFPTTYEIISPGHLGVCALVQTTCMFMGKLRKHVIIDMWWVYNNI